MNTTRTSILIYFYKNCSWNTCSTLVFEQFMNKNGSINVLELFLHCSRSMISSRVVSFFILEPILHSSRTTVQEQCTFLELEPVLEMFKNCSRTADISPFNDRVICQCSWIQTHLRSPTPIPSGWFAKTLLGKVSFMSILPITTYSKDK